LRVRRRLPVVKGAVPTEAEQRERARQGNYGFERAEVLPGNIGYIKFKGFSAMDEAQTVAAAAMSFVQRCDALIFDLRENGGGSPRMIEYLCSYLFPPDTHLNSFKDRLGVETGRTLTHDRIAGPRFADDLPVYVLTSAYTFSAAEEFTYNLQQTRRGTIVGETTGGGAHPVSMNAVNRQFEISLPYQRAENPISKTNWEGTGIVPDIAVTAGAALDAAVSDARQRISSRARTVATGESQAPSE
jgi:C-terminal processing protease CtpA/Prc